MIVSQAKTTGVNEFTGWLYDSSAPNNKGKQSVASHSSLPSSLISMMED
jgi:hypothetical protein